MTEISRHNSAAGQPAASASLSLPVRDVGSPPGAFLVVAIGASAGGLDACRKLVDALPAPTSMAFVLVQHLDPTHQSMLVELIASHTSMTVVQAVDGMSIEREHLYIIPPGVFLAVGNDALHLSQPQERHGARLPFDFLLHSLAVEYGPRAIGVVLSGTGADGSIGLKGLKDKGGYVIAQDPDEAEYDGMPRSAIATGVVDLVLPVAAIADALIKYDRGVTLTPTQNDSIPIDTTEDLDSGPHALDRVIELLRTKTAHDFTLYKPGTLKRRIERRMAMAGVVNDDMNQYLKMLGTDAGELELLAKDLLINVTSFFRDPKVYDFLAQKIIPELVNSHTDDRPLRIWTVGCSTGEEAYSIAMLFIEEIAVSKRNIKVQLLASDVDPDAVTTAREGVYPETIQADVSPARLKRFFSLEDHYYRVLPELRAAIVFTVQDVLADPPFSRLDLVSCRNLLIYLRPEAQEKVVSMFHFALREGGILLLGNAETAGNVEGRFELISKQERLYRHIGRSRPGELNFSMPAGGAMRAPTGPGQGRAPPRQSALAELCRRLVIERYAPAAVLVNHQHECLYSLGATDRYLSVAPGQPTHDLFAMARPGVRNKLRSAIQQATQENVRTIITGGRVTYDGRPLAFRIDVQPVMTEGEALFLVCFVDERQVELKQKPETGHPVEPQNEARVTELEQELEATRAELQGAIRNLEISGEEQKSINEEALSANEEYQSTNEELLTSKEELQSLNEELTALNGQLQETLERQRTTSNDLQNVLYSTDVATLFLDTELKIRFFTPATRSLFSVIPSDIGRPLVDLNSLATDGALSVDAQAVLHSLVPVEREIETRGDTWFTRRILPYRTEDGGVGGVVITFTNITERKHTAKALELARKQAELANISKSRFLAAASHDLRQPLQTLALLQGLLAKTVEGDKGQDLLTRLDETISAMSEMLNTLLDINQIEAGTVHAEMVSFQVNDLLHRLKNEFSFQAQAKGIVLHVASCSLTLYSDPRLLEQVIRNLLSNALKYTPHGKVLLGCRRRHGTLSIEVWDTGVGIVSGELQAIFQEYHQIDNPARERSRGLGLGLSIVQRIADLLGYRLRVHSQPGKGSAFAIEADLPTPRAPTQSQPPPAQVPDQEEIESTHRSGMILIIEDDPEVREALRLVFSEEGHHTMGVADGAAALEWLAQGGVVPDLVLADYNLPNGTNGVQAAMNVREQLDRELPVIILTGDISTETSRDIALHHCEQFIKPVKFKDLSNVIQRLLAIPHA
jgi:two-component system, chemotaxis family, CheB/CheR fusion protein